MLPLALSLLTLGAPEAPLPLALHPDNPRYFVFRGEPTLLIGSGEHYGAVLNLDFDYATYLDELGTCGLNLTRTFTGAYMEDPQSFGIQHNTLAPAEGRLICPWARSDEPGYAFGGSKFDLTRWDEDYFARLRDFCARAGEEGVVVEVVLFCPFYGEGEWALSPMNAANNVNGIGTMGREEVYTLGRPELLAVQDAMTRRIVTELNDLDNVYFEVCNEPYFGGVTLEWQYHIADVIASTEDGLPFRHLIAQNIANETAHVDEPHPAISVFNFHYASPPVAVRENWHLNRPIAFDETGFAGSDDATYRRQAWEFILAGGSAFSNLDYSFTAGYERGTRPVDAPGGGSVAFRRQMCILAEFIRGFDSLRMAPAEVSVTGEGEPSAYCLAQPGEAWAAYVHGAGPVTVSLAAPAGDYRAEWVDVMTGEVVASQDAPATGGRLELPSPGFGPDIALRVTR
jgi:hypothetical protein